MLHLLPKTTKRMDNQLNAIRQLRDSGLSIRDIADRLNIKKHEVEKAFIALKALGQRPDTFPDDYSDNCQDTHMDMYRHTPGKTTRMNSQAKVPKDMPSEWNPNCTRQQADFIISHHVESYDTHELSILFSERWEDTFLSLTDIERITDAYDREQAKRKSVEVAAQKTKDADLLLTFNNYIGEDVLALLLWVNDIEEWNLSEVKACAARTSTVMADVESFCRKHSLSYADYEPYSILKAIENEVEMRARKRDEDVELDETTISFLGMLSSRHNIDRYFCKVLEKSRNSYSRW